MIQRPRSAKIPEAAFASVINGYMFTSSDFTQEPPIGLAEVTKVNYRQYLRLAAIPECLGAISVNVLHPADIQLWLDTFADRPGAQQRAKVALQAVETWAMPRRLLPYPIMTGVKIIGSKGGHIPWSNDQVAFAEKHARPHIARSVTLAANTGQRGSDLIRMCPNDLEAFRGQLGINVRQQKTGLQIWVPVNPALAAAMATWPRLPGPFLRDIDGAAWRNRHQMSEAWNRERDANPQLASLRDIVIPNLPKPRSLVMHGLRATACVRLWELSCPTTLISKMVGLSMPMVERYVRFAAQRQLALAGVKYWDGTGTEQVVTLHPKNQTLTG